MLVNALAVMPNTATPATVLVAPVRSLLVSAYALLRLALRFFVALRFFCLPKSITSYFFFFLRFRLDLTTLGPKVNMSEAAFSLKMLPIPTF